MDNKKNGFVFQKSKEELLEGKSALKEIMKKSYNRNSDKEMKLTDWDEIRDTQSIRYIVMTEGNNAQFLKRSISNVLIRWDKYFYPK